MKETFDLEEGTSSGYQTARTMRKTQGAWLVGTSIPVMGWVAKSKTGRQRRTLGNTHSVIRTQIAQLLDCSGIYIVEMTQNVKRSYKKRKMEQ